MYKTPWRKNALVFSPLKYILNSQGHGTQSKSYSGKLYQVFSIHVIAFFLFFGVIFQQNLPRNPAAKHQSGQLLSNLRQQDLKSYAFNTVKQKNIDPISLPTP